MNFIEEANSEHLTKIVCSNPFLKNAAYVKITLRPVLNNGTRLFHIEKFTATQAFHENVAEAELSNWLQNNANYKYKQICLFFEDRTVTYLFSKKGATRLQKNSSNKISAPTINREKNYIFKEGEDIPAFVDLGIFTKDFKVVQSRYDKFKQINRFIELVDDAFRSYDKEEITILDFGCGKSYLTFFIYYYFVEIKRIHATIIGYDLKSDVVENCNKIARKYGYDNLQFVVADVSKDKLYELPIDMVISLHACDTATDYALAYAVQKQAKYVFSVPCCQHEVNLSIKKGGDMDALLRYGIVKERVSALLTDTIRAMLLEDEGYSVDVLEFVDLAHSPKNLMLRAQKTGKKRKSNRDEVEALMQKYGFRQTLYELLQK